MFDIKLESIWEFVIINQHKEVMLNGNASSNISYAINFQYWTESDIVQKIRKNFAVLSIMSKNP